MNLELQSRGLGEAKSQVADRYCPIPPHATFISFGHLWKVRIHSLYEHTISYVYNNVVGFTFCYLLSCFDAIYSYLLLSNLTVFTNAVSLVHRRIMFNENFDTSLTESICWQVPVEKNVKTAF